MADAMDIEMDIDIGLTEEVNTFPEIEIVRDAEILTDQQDPTPILSHPNDVSDPSALEPTPEKIHLKGLDDLKTHEIREFALEHYNTHPPRHVEWIDDTSANLVYDNADVARDALLSLASMEVTDATLLPALQLIPAKPFTAKSNTNLQVRLAVAGDRKQAGARERSRFYLFNPEYDPAERRKRGTNRDGRKSYRDRDDGGYRSQRYDGREQRRRELQTDFDASLYDDDEVAIAKRSSRPPRTRETREKELFPDRDRRGSGRLRDRSASPIRYSDDTQDSAMTRRLDAVAAENRAKAQSIKARLREAQITKELFPQKTHRRSGAFDAADETADLFANKMSVPFMDGSGDDRMRSSGPLASRIGRRDTDGDVGFSIRGTAKRTPVAAMGFSIKGAASGSRSKELFPTTVAGNAGKELFSEALEGRGMRRQKAEDLFL